MTPEPQRGFIPIDLDKRRIIAFDMAATWLLIQKYGPRFLPELYKAKEGGLFELVSMDALAYFLWAGLRRDAKANDEELALATVQEFLRPWTYAGIFERVLYAVVGATTAPEMPGKAEATVKAAKPAAGAKAAADPGPTLVSTSSMRRGSRSPNSTGRRKSSGRTRRAS